MSVLEYLDKHMLPRKIEDAVNAAVRAKTPDPVLFISNHMRKSVPSVITKVLSRQIIDSRGIPTVEVDLHTKKGVFLASSPSGASSVMLLEMICWCQNPKRIERAMQEAACNTLLLKVNQVGTVTEAIEVVKLAKDANWGVVMSQRSSESEDSFIADLSVGLSAGQIKAGAPCRGQRLVMYNQLLRIEEELGDRALYAGDDRRYC